MIFRPFFINHIYLLLSLIFKHSFSPALWEVWIQFLGWEDPLEKRKLPTPIFWPGESRGLQSMDLQRVGHDWATFTFTFLFQKRGKEGTCLAVQWLRPLLPVLGSCVWSMVGELRSWMPHNVANYFLKTKQNKGKKLKKLKSTTVHGDICVWLV